MRQYIALTGALLLGMAAARGADEDYGYVVRLSWIGDPVMQDMNLILRNPEDAGTANDYAPRDCYYGQTNPDWGIQDYDNDDPLWSKTRIGDTNIEEIVCHDLFDIGTFVILARAHAGDAVCSLEISRWRYKNVDERDEKWLIADTTSREAAWMRASLYNDMGIRMLKFKQHKKKKKFKIKTDFTTLPDEIPTNEPVRVYLDNELVLEDDGSGWDSNKKDTKFKIGKPWEMKIKRKSNYRIFIRGIADGDYRRKTVQCNIVIGDYLGTNSFYVNKKGKYKFKEKKEIYDD